MNEDLSLFFNVDDFAVEVTIDGQKINGIFNIGTGQGRSVNSIYQELLSISGINKQAEYGPEKNGELKKVVLDSGKALGMTGWEARSNFQDTLKDTLEWMVVDKRKRCKGCPK